MTLPHRIAAGGIIIRNDSILLVRYRNTNRSTYLVGPGGAVKTEENIFQAVTREILEETCVVVRPYKVILVEDLVCSRYKMCKIWTLCEFISGDVQMTEKAREEGIVDSGWFTRSGLAEETVFPALLMQQDWRAFCSPEWKVEFPPTENVSF